MMIAMIILIVMLFASCSPQGTIDGGSTGSIVVRVIDSIAKAKAGMLWPDDGAGTDVPTVDVTHYVISLYKVDGAGSSVSGDTEPTATSGFIASGGEYEAKNVETGTWWIAKVDAYVQYKEGTAGADTAILVATAESSPTEVVSERTAINVTLSSLLQADENKGDAEVTMLLPPGTGNDVQYKYDVYTNGESGLQAISTLSRDWTALSGISEESATVTISAIPQGRYVFIFSLRGDKDSAGTYHIERSVAVPVYILPGLTSTGTVDLTQTESVSPDITITNELGTTVDLGTITPTTTAAVADTGKGTLTLAFPDGFDATAYTLTYYIDGKEATPTDSAFSVDPGKHTLLIFVKENDGNGVGSAVIDFEIDPYKPTLTPVAGA